MSRVLVIGTVETKGPAIDYLTSALGRHGLSVELLDISLGAVGQPLGGPAKLALMEQRARQAAQQAADKFPDCIAAVGMGGGTGGEVILGAFRGLPARYPKFLVTTLAFDPRAALADTAVTLIPTLCDIEGMNSQLASVFDSTAAMVAGMADLRVVPQPRRTSIGVTTLGATGAAGAHIAERLEAQGFEATLYHANGYGGAAFNRFTAEGRFDAVIDLNVHELGRMRLAGAHVGMPERFTAASHLPRVVLPGALNFIGLGMVDTIAKDYLARPHYRHSGHFTHVKLTGTEMESQAEALAQALNKGTGETRVIVPMGGFSHQDRPGGAIEDPRLREIAAEILSAEARAFSVDIIPFHINAPETAAAAVAALNVVMGLHDEKRTNHG